MSMWRSFFWVGLGFMTDQVRRQGIPLTEQSSAICYFPFLPVA